MSVDNMIPRYLVGTASLAFGSIDNAACAALTFALAGALPTDGIAPIWQSAMDTGFTGSMRVSTADTVGTAISAPARRATHNTIRMKWQETAPSVPMVTDCT